MFNRNALKLTPIATACCMLAACGSDNNGSSGTTYSGVVASSAYVSGSKTGDPTLKPGYYQGATVCMDSEQQRQVRRLRGLHNDRQPTASSRSSPPSTGQFIADIPTSATNTASGGGSPVT